MPEWSLFSIAFFACVAAAGELRPGVAARARVRVRTGAALGIALAASASRLPADGIAAGWLLPPAVLLVGYWTTAFLFVRPMPRFEAALLAIDRALRVTGLAERSPRLVAELLELAYSGIYLAIAVALVAARHWGTSADRFWTVILVTDFVCFGMLPFLQSRPPRSLETRDPWRSSWRAVNLRLLQAGSVQVNTFPSGHAAEAVAVALLVGAAPLPVIVVMWIAAAAISAGAVLGRYHYTADAIAGWAVAWLVWRLT